MKKFFSHIAGLFRRGTEKTTLQKQERLAIICLAVLIAGCLIYFPIIYPLTKRTVESQIELIDGEAYDSDMSSLLIMPKLGREDIKNIFIKNESGYTEYRSEIVTLDDGTKYKNFTLSADGVTMNDQAISGLVVNIGWLMTDMPASGTYRVNDRATYEDLSQYGFKGEGSDLYAEVELENGGSYKIILGNKLPTKSGYYAMLEGRRNKVTVDGEESEYYVVYLLSSVTSNYITQSKTSYINTKVSPSYGNAINAITDFCLYRRQSGTGSELSERPLVVQINPIDAGGVAATGSYFKLTYPGVYMLDEDLFNNTVLSVIGDITAAEIMEFGNSIFNEEVYGKYGLDLDKTRLENGTDKNRVKLTYCCAESTVADGKDTVLYIGERFTDTDNEQYYYVYSVYSNVIAKVLGETLKFVDWTATKYTSGKLYYEYFSSCDNFELVSEKDGYNFRFNIYGNDGSYKVDLTTAGGDSPILRDDGKVMYYTDENHAVYRFSKTDKYYYFDGTSREYTQYSGKQLYCVRAGNGDIHFYTDSALTTEIKASDVKSGCKGLAPLLYEEKYKVNNTGTIPYNEYYGDFEIFRDLYYVLITRNLALDEEASDYKDRVIEKPAITMEVKTEPRDQPVTYYKYDENGNRIYNSTTQNYVQVRYLGGYLACSDVSGTRTVNGETFPVKYDLAFYDATAGRFFIKTEDKNDGNSKPTNYKYDSNNNLVISTYLPKGLTGKYTDTRYNYEIHEVYDEYTDENGKTVKVINQTYYYVVTVKTMTEYSVCDGEIKALSTETETSDTGVLVRRITMETLIEDIQCLFDSREIDIFGIN